MTLKKLFILAMLVVIVLLGSRVRVAAQDKVVTPAPAIGAEHADDAPLAFPPIEHYAKLWENSMFTTKSLPPPDDAPKGPIFTDNLTLVVAGGFAVVPRWGTGEVELEDRADRVGRVCDPGFSQHFG